MKKKPRIPVSGAQEGIQSPFASLEIAGLPEGICLPPVPAAVPPRTKNGRVVLRREKAQRGGKTVVVVSGFEPHISSGDIERLAREARQSCGCGGTVREREIELQGDSPERVRGFFEKAGFRVAGV
jgi:translation initiation factor 1